MDCCRLRLQAEMLGQKPLFSPGIWWIGLTMSRSGSEVQILRCIGRE